MYLKLTELNCVYFLLDAYISTLNNLIHFMIDIELFQKKFGSSNKSIIFAAKFIHQSITYELYDIYLRYRRNRV